MGYVDELTDGTCDHDSFWYGRQVQVNLRYDLHEEVEGVFCTSCGALVAEITDHEEFLSR